MQYFFNLLPMSTQFRWVKGAVHIVARREFIEFAIQDVRALSILGVLQSHERENKKGIVADETYFATLNHNPKTIPVPGAFTGNTSLVGQLHPVREKQWIFDGVKCMSGTSIRGICIFGVNDLPYLVKSKGLFANKFLPEIEPEAYDMVEAWLKYKIQYESTHEQIHPSFNVTYYENLHTSLNHL